MRIAALTILMLALVAASCSSGSGNSATVMPAQTSRQTATPSSSAKTPAPAGSSTAGGSAEEVSGIVGNVNTSTRTIQIDRRSGASVTRISVLPTTAIHSAAGATLTLAGIRTSDRIVARGSVNDQGDALMATDITVSQAVPGQAPSG